jgi:ELWxxDGT repeat protein
MKKNLPFIINSRKWRLAIALSTVMLLTAALKAQPVLVKDIPPGSHSFVTADGLLYFASGDSLFTATAGSVTFVKKLNESVAGISEVTIGNKVFIVTNAGTQKGLWVSSGTSASTVKVAMYPAITPVIANGSDLYLSINDGSHGLEPWKLTSSNSLSMLKDINPGSANGVFQYPFFSFTISNSQVFFLATDAGGNDIWKSNGTSAGTVKAVDLSFGGVFQLKDVNGTMFFNRDSTNSEWGDQSTELWKTQGTAASTQLVKSFGWSYPYHGLTNFTSHNGKLFFMRHHGNPDQDLMASDGTEAGTYTVKANVNYDGHIERMVSFQNYVAFYGQSQGFPTGIYKSDGTPGNISEVRQLNYIYAQGGSMAYVDLTVADDRLFFIDHGGNPGQHPTPSLCFTKARRLMILQQQRASRSVTTSRTTTQRILRLKPATMFSSPQKVRATS